MPSNLSIRELLSLYEDLVLVRECEQRIRREYFKDEMKTPVHLGIGAEAISVGVNFCLPPRSRVFATYRNHAIFLSVTQDTDSFFGELYGKATGCAKGKAGSMHLAHPTKGLLATSAIVGTTIPLAVGAALAADYCGDDGLICVFFGDGALEEGVFWESLNFACLRKLPVLFVCEDNGLAIHASGTDRRGFKTLRQVVEAFGCPFYEGDGADLLGIIEGTTEVLSRQGNYGGPGFLHLHYHRFLEHVGTEEDYGIGYRCRPEAPHMHDPLERFRCVLRERDVPEQKLIEIQTAVLQRIEKSVRNSQAAPFPGPGELYSDVFSSGAQTQVREPLADSSTPVPFDRHLPKKFFLDRTGHRDD